MEQTFFAEIWQAYRSGDAAARNRLLTDFAPRIAGLIKKYLRHPGQREDVEQSVLVSFLANHGAELDHIAQADELWQLFAAITLRHCSKHNKRRFRAHQRGAEIPLQGGASEEGGQPGFTPVDGELPPDMKAAIADLFAQCNKDLTARQQQVLAEHLAGTDRKDIAKTLTISIPTVDRELSKIKALLKQLAGDDDE